MIKKLRQVKEIRVATRQLFNALIGMIGAIFFYYQSQSPILTIIIGGVAIPLLNMLTKYINTTVFGDLGVK